MTRPGRMAAPAVVLVHIRQVLFFRLCKLVLIQPQQTGLQVVIAVLRVQVQLCRPQLTCKLVEEKQLASVQKIINHANYMGNSLTTMTFSLGG